MWETLSTSLHSWIDTFQTHGIWLRYAGGTGLTLLILLLSFHFGRQARRHTRSLLRALRCFDEAVIPGLGSLAQYGVYLVGAGILLNLWGVNPTAVLAVLGTIGITIGLALRNTLSNIASGILLLLLRPFSPGDLIECGAVSGKVREINLFTTLVDTPDGILVEVTNGVLWGPPIRNLTRRAHRRLEIPCPSLSESGVAEAELRLRNALAGDARLCPKPLPSVVPVPREGGTMSHVARIWVLPGLEEAAETVLRADVARILSPE